MKWMQRTTETLSRQFGTWYHGIFQSYFLNESLIAIIRAARHTPRLLKLQNRNSATAQINWILKMPLYLTSYIYLRVRIYCWARIHTYTYKWMQFVQCTYPSVCEDACGVCQLWMNPLSFIYQFKLHIHTTQCNKCKIGNVRR